MKPVGWNPFFPKISIKVYNLEMGLKVERGVWEGLSNVCTDGLKYCFLKLIQTQHSVSPPPSLLTVMLEIPIHKSDSA